MKSYISAFYSLVLLLTLSLAFEPASANEPEANEGPVLSTESIDRWLQVAKRNAEFHGRQGASDLKRLDKLISDKDSLKLAVDSVEHPMYQAVQDAIGSAYYDRLYVYETLYKHDQNQQWLEFAADHLKIWTAYIKASGGVLAGRWAFPLGLKLNYLRTSNKSALDALKLIVDKAHYVRDSFPDESTWAFSNSPIRSREVAYALRTRIAYDQTLKKQRDFHRPALRTIKLANFALGHLDQWFNEKSEWIVPHEDGEMLGSPTRYVRAFMVGLTINALLEYYEAYHDASEKEFKEVAQRIIPAITSSLQKLWKSSWNNNARAFSYTDRQMSPENRDYDELGQDPQPDLNMLLASVYYRTGKLNPKATVEGLSFKTCSDQIFLGALNGVTEWSWQQNKQFNQQFFHHSIEYLKERREELN